MTNAEAIYHAIVGIPASIAAMSTLDLVVMASFFLGLFLVFYAFAGRGFPFVASEAKKNRRDWSWRTGTGGADQMLGGLSSAGLGFALMFVVPHLLSPMSVEADETAGADCQSGTVLCCHQVDISQTDIDAICADGPPVAE